MVTLHAYVLRELLKSLALTVTALTALFTMGGGLYNVIRFEGISTGDVLHFIPLLIPIVVTLTLPMAALFAVTMVYGRLAADNELLACRAAGVNVHRLFVSAILLSIFVAAFSLLFGNFIIPGFAQQISNYARNNLRDMVFQHLQGEGFIHHRDKKGGASYTLTAEEVQGVSDDWLRAGGWESGPGLQYLVVTNPTLLHIDTDGNLARFTSARHGVCLFDTRPTPVELTVFVYEGRDFEVGKRAVYIGEQQIGPVSVPLPSPFRLSTADLRSLLYWRRAPWAAPRLSAEINDFRVKLTQRRFFAYCAQQLTDNGEVTLFDDFDREYRITCAAVREDGKGLTLTGGQVGVYSPEGTLTASHHPEWVELRTTPWPSQILVQINLVGREPRGSHGREPWKKSTTNIDGALVPNEVLREMERYTPATSLKPDIPLPAGGEVLADKRISLQKEAGRLQRRIAATIHFRFGYTSSVLVTVLMGAALGVIFRGSRALAAFALATIPFFSVMILMMLGKQLSEDANTTPIGPFITWGGLLLVLVADLIILRLGVRR